MARKNKEKEKLKEIIDFDAGSGNEKDVYIKVLEAQKIMMSYLPKLDKKQGQVNFASNFETIPKDKLLIEVLKGQQIILASIDKLISKQENI